MKRHHARPARRVAVLALAGLSLFGPGRAVAEPSGAEPPGIALVIGIDRDAASPGEGVCGPAARGVRDRLNEQGLAVQAVFNPSAVAMRTTIDSFAMQVEASSPAFALIYACGMAAPATDRLFLMPSDAGSDGRVDPIRQGIVLQALLNALAGTGGTFYADLGLTDPAAASTAGEETGKRLPAGLHLALGLSKRDGAARIGERLAGSGFRASQGWDATAAMLQAGTDFPDGAVQMLLPPAQDAGSRTPSEPADAMQPPGADSSAPVRPQAAGSQPKAPLRPPAPAPNSDRIKRLQAALARTGYAGPVDGRLNGSTTAAIQQFQHSLGNPETGVLTQTELVYLLNRRGEGQ